MRVSHFALLAGLSLAACAPSGYYDSTGAYHSYGASDSYRTNTPRGNEPAPGGNPGDYRDDRSDYRDYRAPQTTMAEPAGTTVVYERPAYHDVPTTTTVIYERPGTYDYNGYYISSDSGPEVPGRYYPPHGMCRVWFTDRALSEQPPVESCTGIEHRVPSGAYVVYGG